jgi:multiple sugar transport system permease protein
MKAGHAMKHSSSSGRTSIQHIAVSDGRFGAALAAPATLAVALLVGIPTLLTILNSFQKVSFNGPNKWIGFDNFVLVLTSPIFYHSLWITIVYTLGFLTLSTLLGLGFALLLNENFRLRALGRTLLIIPWAAPWLMVGIMWKWFIDANVGGLNGILYQFQLIDDYIPFLADTKMALLFTILAASWRQASLSGLLFLAALQTVPRDLLEAATVDGATARQRFLYITLPWLSPVLLVVLVTNTIFGFLMFDVVFIMTHGGPGNATEVLSLLLYRLIFNFSNVGGGSAVAVVIAFITFAIGLILVRILYNQGSESSN